jgi:hypothetical protein
VPGRYKVTNLGQQLVNGQKKRFPSPVHADQRLGFQAGSLPNEELLVPILQLAYRLAKP